MDMYVNMTKQCLDLANRHAKTQKRTSKDELFWNVHHRRAADDYGGNGDDPTHGPTPIPRLVTWRSTHRDGALGPQGLGSWSLGADLWSLWAAFTVILD